MSTETQSLPIGEWITHEKFAYLLHETGKYSKGMPEVCNKFFFSIQPDYAHGVTNEDAAEELDKIMVAVNNHSSLLEALKEVHSLMLDIHTALDNKTLNKAGLQQVLKDRMYSTLQAIAGAEQQQ